MRKVGVIRKLNLEPETGSKDFFINSAAGTVGRNHNDLNFSNIGDGGLNSISNNNNNSNNIPANTGDITEQAI